MDGWMDGGGGSSSSSTSSSSSGSSSSGSSSSSSNTGLEVYVSEMVGCNSTAQIFIFF